MAPTPVTFGFLLPTREMVMAQQRPDLRPLLILAERAEALGFDSVWVGDSILARPRLEALTTLAAVAARTQRVRLGTAVLLPAAQCSCCQSDAKPSRRHADPFVKELIEI